MALAGLPPHLDAPGLAQHVGFRLADSLHARIRETIAKTPSFDRVQAVGASLDQGHGQKYLAIAGIVHRALEFDGERYSMIAWCVMPKSRPYPDRDAQPAHPRPCRARLEIL
jgi:putative transposase